MTNQDEIIDLQKKYYQKLYSNPSTKSIAEKQDYLDNIEVNSLNDEDSKKCDGMLTREDILKSIKSFKSGKAPGNDGLTVELYHKFSSIITEPLWVQYRAVDRLPKTSCHQTIRQGERSYPIKKLAANLYFKRRL
jgi:hypothetical protein